MQQSSILSLPSAEFPQRYFQIIKYLGKGSQGEVFRASPKNWGNFTNDVALKFQPQIQNEELQFITNLIQYQNVEHQIQRNQKSQIIRVYDVVKHGDKYIQIMELAELDLYKYLQIQKGNLDIWQKLSIMKQISQSIWFLHFNNKIHRDLKPENFVKVNEEFKLIDFGTLKSNQQNKLHTSYVGSPLFQSPEISQGKTQYSIEIDIWSLGCTFYEILTENSFDNQNYSLNNYQLKSNQPIQQQVDKEFRQLLSNMLQQQSEQRIKIQQVITQLNKFEGQDQFNQQKNVFLQQQKEQQNQWTFPNNINQKNNFLGNNQQIKNNPPLQTDVNLSQIEKLIIQLETKQSNNFEQIQKQLELVNKPHEQIQNQYLTDQTQQLQLNIQQEIKNQFTHFQTVMQEQIKTQFINQIQQNNEVNQKNQLNNVEMIQKVDEIKDTFKAFKDKLEEKINTLNNKSKSIEQEIQNLKEQTQYQFNPQTLDPHFQKQNQQIISEMRKIKDYFQNNLNNEKIQFQQFGELQQSYQKFQCDTGTNLNKIQLLVSQSNNLTRNNQQTLDKFSNEFDLIKSKLNEIQSQSQKIQFSSDQKERSANYNKNSLAYLQKQENVIMDDKIIENTQKQNQIGSSNQYNQFETNRNRSKSNFASSKSENVQDVTYQVNTTFSQNIEQAQPPQFEIQQNLRIEDIKNRSQRTSSAYSKPIEKNFDISLSNYQVQSRKADYKIGYLGDRRNVNENI